MLLIASSTKSITKTKAYENKEFRIIFFPVAILSSSPKLNFLISKPEPIATAAAGVAILTIHLLIVLSADSNFEIIFAVAAKVGFVDDITNKNDVRKILKAT